MQTGLIALLGLASLFVGWILTFILPQIRYISWGILAVGAMLILVAFIIDYRRVGKAIISRRGRFGTSATLMVSVFIGIILLVNAISIGNNTRFDTTGLSRYTLTSQTKDVLTNLDKKVKIIKFFVPDDPYGVASYATSLLDEYQNYTDELDVNTIDPDLQPDVAREYGITAYQEWFFSYYGFSAQVVVFVGDSGERFVGLEEMFAEAEHAFTSAILEVTGTVQKVVYFVTGHGEADIYDISTGGYSSVREGLKDNLFQTATLDLLDIDAIPDNAAAVVLAAPSKETPLTKDEIGLLLSYLLDGGHLLVLVNPDRPDAVNTILAPWGVLADKEILIDPSSYTAPNIDSPSVPRTRNYWGLSTTYFPGATAIAKIPTGEAVKYAQAQPLLWTSTDAYLDADYSPGTTPQYDEGIDTKGQMAIGFLIQNVLPGSEEEDEEVTIPEDFRDTRLVVIGDSDFATNKHFINGGNSDLILTSVQWLTAGSSIISIDQKVLQSRRFILSAEAANFVKISSIGLLPLLLLVAGTIVWWRRR